MTRPEIAEQDEDERKKEERRRRRRAAAARRVANRIAKHTDRAVKRSGYSIDEFCFRNGFSRAHYYNLKAQQLAPEEMRALGKIIITDENERRWHKRIAAVTKSLQKQKITVSKRSNALTALALVLLVSPAVARDISGPATVLDGDTVRVNGTTIRLKGVDASERGSARGEAARRAMIAIVDGDLTCQLTGERTWNREVGTCTTSSGVDINREIIAQGRALSCPRYSTRYVQYEQPEAIAAQPRAHYCVRGAR